MGSGTIYGPGNAKPLDKWRPQWNIHEVTVKGSGQLHKIRVCFIASIRRTHTYQMEITVVSSRATRGPLIEVSATGASPPPRDVVDDVENVEPATVSAPFYALMITFSALVSEARPNVS